MDLPSRIASWLGENEGTISAVVGIIVYTQAVGGSSPSAPTGRLTFHVLAAMAELERDLIRERTMAGLELARKKGKKLGRPPVLDKRGLARARRMAKAGRSTRQIAEVLGISQSAAARAVKEARC